MNLHLILACSPRISNLSCNKANNSTWIESINVIFTEDKSPQEIVLLKDMAWQRCQVIASQV